MKPPIHLNRSPFAEDNPEGLHPAPHTPDYRSYRPARGGSRSAALLVLTARVVWWPLPPCFHSVTCTCCRG